MKQKILIIDDEPEILHILETILTAERFQVRKASGGREALALCQAESFDLAITDIKMPGMDGLELITHLKAQVQDIEVLVLTGFATIDNTIEALRAHGAFDFLKKPLDNLDAFFHTIHRALETRELHIQDRELLEKLRNHRDHLEEMVAERTAELQQEILERKQVEEDLKKAKDAAEVANRAKSEFIANMSHELWTPLNSILGFAHLLKSAQDLTEKQRENLNIIQRNGEHLLTLLNDILEISRIEADKLEWESAAFNLSDALTTVVEMTRLHAKQKGLSFFYEEDSALPYTVYGDEKRLRQTVGEGSTFWFDIDFAPVGNCDYE